MGVLLLLRTHTRMEVLSQMTDKSQPAETTQEPIPPAQTSEPVTTPKGEATDKQQVEPQYVTKEDMEGFAADILRRAKQSDRDRGKAIDGKLNEIKSLLEKAGTQVSVEQERAIRNQIIDQIDGDEEPQPTGQSAVPSQPAPVEQFLAGVFAEAGATVTPNDPEWKDIQAVIDRTWNDPQGLPKVLVAATKAANAKSTRTTAMQETAAARVGGGGSTTPGNVPATTGRDMLSQAYSQKK